MIHNISGLLRCRAAGVFAVAVACFGASPVAADVVLNGITHTETGTTVSGFSGQFYNFVQQSDTPAAVDNLDGSRMFQPAAFAGYQQYLTTTTPGATGTMTQINFTGTGAPLTAFGFTNTDNFTARWVGQINITDAGSTTFFTNSDDGSTIWIDGVMVVNNNAFQGNTERSGSINLSAGQHEIVVGYFEGTGDNVMGANYTPFGGAKGLITSTVVQGHQLTAINRTADNFLLSASSTLQTNGALQVNAGQLQVSFGGNPITLTNTGATYNFTGTTFADAGTLSVTSANSVLADMRLGQINDNGHAVTIVKQGINTLILDQTTAANTTGNTNFNVQAGTLAAFGATGGNNPLGTAGVTLSGTTSILALGSKTGTSFTFDNAIDVTESAQIVARRYSSAGPNNATITLGSATKGITVAAGKTVTLGIERMQTGDTTNLTIAGSITGAGNVVVDNEGNTVTFAAGATHSYGGTLTKNNDGTLQINTLIPTGITPNGGTVVFGGGAIQTFTSALTINSGATVRIDTSGAISAASGINVANNGVLNLNVANALNTSVPVSIASGGRLHVNNATGVSANVTIGSGAILEIGVAGLTGSGVITHGPGSNLRLSNAGALSGAQLPASSIVSGEVLQINTANPTGISGLIPTGIIYEIFGADRALTANASLNLDGQILTNDGSTRTVTDSTNIITAGSNGLTLAASSSTTFTVGETVNVGTGTVTVGSTTNINGRAKAGITQFSGAAANTFIAGQVDIVNGTFVHNGGGATFVIGGGTGSLNIASGRTFTSNTAILIDARIVNNGGTINFGVSGPTAAGSVEGTGNLVIGHATTAGLTTLTVGSNNLSTSYGGVISNQNAARNGAIVKVGSGIMTLTAANTYSGGTTVMEGTLRANNLTGSGLGSGAVQVNAGARLGGTGSISGAVTINDLGILAPGASPGTLTLTSLVIGGELSKLEFELDTPNIVGGGVNDLIVVNGALTLNGQLQVTGGANFGAGTYRLFNYTGALTDQTLSVSIMPSGFSGTIDLSTIGQVNLNVSAVPEPSTLALAGLGLLGLAWGARRRGGR